MTAIKSVLKDNEARSIIETDFKRSIAVNAGAGSGKTHEMVQRIINGIKNNIISMEKVAVITFTRKAAAEMRSRIIEELNKLIINTDDSISRDKYHEQLIIAVTAQISTIHSFCSGLLKEKPVEAGIDPAFEMIEGADSEFFEKVFEEYIHTLFTERKESKMYGAIESLILKYGFELNSSDYGHGNIPSVQDLLQTFTVHRDSKLAIPLKTDGKKLLKEIESFFSRCIDDTEESTKLQDKYRSIKEEFDLISKDIDKLSKFKFSAGNTGGAKEWKEYKDNATAEFDELLNKYIYSLKYEELKEIYDKLTYLFEDFITYYRTCEIRDGLLDNEDLLIYTRNILRDKPEIREYFKERYTHIFVDEFQDTDPVQTEIVFFLSEMRGVNASSWQDVQVEKGKLFIIGDMKQAIYNFRRADVTSFIKAMDKIGSKNTLSLTSNFRSNEKVLEFINNHFQNTMTGQDDYSPRFEPLNTVEKNKDSSKKMRVIAVTPPEVDHVYNADELRTLQSDTAVRWIIDNKGKRFKKWSEVTILARYSSALTYLQNAFEKKDIPCEIAGSRSYFGRYEVQALATVLKAVVDPADKISIYGALKGPFFGHSDRELREFYKDKSISIFADNKESTVGKSCGILASLHNDSLYKRSDEIITRLYDETGILQGLAAGYMGREKVYNLIKAKEFIRRKGDGVLLVSLDELINAIENGAEMADLKPASGERDAVQIMSIHRAKGLENRVIYLADVASQKTTKSTTLAHNGYIYMKHSALKLYEYSEINEENRLKENAEEERLRYVAATRASDYLVFNNFNVSKGMNKAFIYPFYSSLDNSGMVSIEETALNSSDDINPDYSVIKPKISSALSKQQAEWCNNLEVLKTKGAESLFKIINPSSFTDVIEDSLQIEVSFSPEDMKTTVFQHKGAAADTGTIVHRLLETAAGLSEKDLKRLTEGLIKRDKLEIDPGRVLTIYKRITANETYIRSLKSKRVFRELPILFNHEGALVNGIIDLLFEDESGWVLADYKILINPEAAKSDLWRDKHRGQLDLYEIGLQKSGITVKEKLLIV